MARRQNLWPVIAGTSFFGWRDEVVPRRRAAGQTIEADPAGFVGPYRDDAPCQMTWVDGDVRRSTGFGCRHHLIEARRFQIFRSYPELMDPFADQQRSLSVPGVSVCGGRVAARPSYFGQSRPLR